jgi:S-methylmethionine-dependent homocysteine/selenocysteine methylase
MGTELLRRGAVLDGPLWSARALLDRPDLVLDVHRDYVAAGASVITTATFRTTRRALGEHRALDPRGPDPERWEELVEIAVSLARSAAGSAAAGRVRVAGSMAPVADCYRPWETPRETRAHHRASAEALRRAGTDLLLCETFADGREALVAVEEAVATGLPTWLALTAGPDARLLSPDAVGRIARDAVSAGASSVLVDCVPATATLACLEPLGRAGVPFGAYANAGAEGEGLGWLPGWSERPGAPSRYAAIAASWVRAGASLVGGCCGTGPLHVQALRAALEADERR